MTSPGIAEGFTDNRFAQLRDLFTRNFEQGNDLGASVCITVDGETVVDLWGGHADAERVRPWQRDTLVNVYSCTKTMGALVALMLADDRVLDFDAPVHAYWPEFAQNGKSDVLVRHVMSHSAGLPEWDVPLTVHDLYDWDKTTGLLAAQPLAWAPGSAPGYHSLTQGYLLGEIVRRCTGRTLGTILRERIAEPLQADFHIGLPAHEDARVADLVAATPDAATVDRGHSAVALDITLPGTRAWRAAEIPAANGFSNARAMAQIHCMLANDGVIAGTRYLSTAMCRKALETQVEGQDRVLGRPMRFGLGFALGGGMMPSPDTLYWGGYGGSLVIIDMTTRTTFAYAMNRMSSAVAGDGRAFELAMAMWEAQGLI